MARHILIFSGLLIAVLFGGWLWLAQPDVARLPVTAVMGARPTISEPRNEIWPTIKVADVVGWQGGAMPTPAAGLAVQPFAQGLDHPRWLLTLPNGDVLVAESNSPPRQVGGITGLVMGWLLNKAGAGVPSANRITLLRDGNGDGVAEQKSVLIGGLNSPMGMALLDGQLYIANTDALVRVPFTPGQTRITAKPEVVVRYPGGGNHWARTVLPGADGKLLYVTVGSASNIAENGIEEETGRACILEVDPARKTMRIYAGGLRNPQGLALEPKSKRLWTTVNERDMQGSDLAPDYLTAVEFGDFFGWPYYYWGGYPDKRVEPKRPDLQEYSKRPDYALGPHTASLGLAFADGARLGPRFADGAFIGQHGSWNRVPVSGYKVIYVPFAENGFPAKGAAAVDVLTGFLDKDGNARGRPVGVALDGAGALLVADDVGNVIWRVRAKG
ncbi:sorbosone dehydrogenase family protein [Sphingomonas sp.]|uniref:PQQ-dependent sugar dehydrogenase n=1 Tax=Sphingomonas sp. TaxID=28214 RepID=UPI001DC9503D|nr:sorbosone dehydrogenase family protein [Sphingomonas sp.]MBX9796691.1 sorbosone dehydrogenase family protein [Sphingomonas sp.]